MSIMRFKPILITYGDNSVVLRPYDTLADLAFLEGGIDKSRCVQLRLLLPYKLLAKVPFDVPKTCSVHVGRDEVEWDGTSIASLTGEAVEDILWDLEILPGDRIEFRDSSGPKLPKWDADRRELHYGVALIKQFKSSRGTNQEILLSSFEETGWPARLDDPLPPKDGIASKRRLSDTIDGLNENHINEGVIKFRGDGSGEGVIWDAT